MSTRELYGFNWTIKDIENITEDEAKKMCGRQHMTIKGHECYFVDFGGYFGYSVLVFCEGRHIYYANDYALHHKHFDYEAQKEIECSYDELLKTYLEGLNHKLYTDDELEIVNSYDDYKAKENYLHNYYTQRREHISIFFIGSDEERAERREKIKDMTYDEYAFAYFDKADSEFVKRHKELVERLEDAKAKNEDNYEYWKSAFKAEMYNHEYGINWQGDYDVLSAFGALHFTERADEVACYFEQLGFTQTQRNAYISARYEYSNETKEWD